MAKPANKEVIDGKISKVLSQGILLTMEDDLRRMQAHQSRELRFQKQRESTKMMPVSDARIGVGSAPTRAAPVTKPGFLNKIKGVFKKEKDLAKKARKPAVETRPPFVSKDISPTPPVKKQGLRPLGTDTSLKKPALKPSTVPPIAVPRQTEKVVSREKQDITGVPATPMPTPVQHISPVQKPGLPETKPPLPIKPPVAEKTAVAPKPEPKLKQVTITKEEADEIISKRKELKEEVVVLEKQLKDITFKKEPFETKITESKKTKQNIQVILAPILEKEVKFEAEEKSIEAEESKATSIQEKHKLDQKRWSAERQRRKVEHQKWVEEEKIELENAEIAKIQGKLKVILDKENGLRKKRQLILKKLEQAELFETRAKFGESKKELEKQLSVLASKEKEVKQIESVLEQKEKQAKTTKERRSVEKQRWEVETQRKKIEQKQWQIEQKKQALQEEVRGILPLKEEAPHVPKLPIPTVVKPLEKPTVVVPEVSKVKEVAPAVVPSPIKKATPLRRRGKGWQPVKHVDTPGYTREEEILQPKQAAIAPLKSASEAPLQDMTEEELIQRVRENAREEEKKKKLQTIKKRAQVQKNGAYVPKSKGPISKAKILQKLSTISSKEQAARESFLIRVSGKPQPIVALFKGEDGEVVFRPVVRRSSVLQKIAARVMFLVLIVGTLIVVALLLHTYVFSGQIAIKPGPVPEEPICGDGIMDPEEECDDGNTINDDGCSDECLIEIGPEPPPPLFVCGDGIIDPEEECDDGNTINDDGCSDECLIEEVLDLPVSLIDVSEIQISHFSPVVPLDEILASVVSGESIEGDGFVQILLIESSTNTTLDLKGFFTGFDVDTPEGFLESLEKPATLFAYSGGGKTRFGFTAKVTNSSTLIDSMKSWEKTIEQDTETLMEALGKTSTAISDKFITAKHGNEGFRYQTFTKDDFGLVWAVTYSDYFIFTTSYEAMQKTLDNLANQ